MKHQKIQNLRKTRRHRGGFSLIEVLVAAGMFAVGMVGIVALFPAALIQSQNAKDNAIAATVGLNALEYVRGRGFRPNPRMDGKFNIYIPNPQKPSDRRWASSFIKASENDHSYLVPSVDFTLARHKFSATFQTTNTFPSGEKDVIQPFLLNPYELLYWPTGPNVAIAQPNKRLNKIEGEADSASYDLRGAHFPKPVSTLPSNDAEDYAVRSYVDSFQAPTTAWTFGYYQKDSASPTKLYIFVYKVAGIDLETLETDEVISDNVYEAGVFQYNNDPDSVYQKDLVNEDNFPSFFYSQNKKYEPMHFTLKKTSNGSITGRSKNSSNLVDGDGEERSPLEMLRKGQILLNTKTGTILTIIRTLEKSAWNNWDGDNTVLYQNFEKMLSKDDFRKLFDSDFIRTK